MRLGLFGGTFDPVHLGHLRAAESARLELGLDRVLLVPAAQPPHRASAVSSALDRYTMAALACAGSAAFVASDLEMRRDGTSYTIDTVATLQAERPSDQLVLLLGSDAFAELGSWRDAELLCQRVEVAVVSRPGVAVIPELGGLFMGGRGVSVVKGPGVDVSSTTIRALVRDGGSIRYLVSDSVEDYIQKRGLYR